VTPNSALQRTAGHIKCSILGAIKCWRAGAHHHFLGERASPARWTRRWRAVAELGSYASLRPARRH